MVPYHIYLTLSRLGFLGTSTPLLVVVVADRNDGDKTRALGGSLFECFQNGSREKLARYLKSSRKLSSLHFCSCISTSCQQQTTSGCVL
eukprot:scaffold10860_cov182-Amphora_coffeaeformis.AAC.3